VWRAPETKEVIISFRGTEAIRDFITDLMIMQEPLTPVSAVSPWAASPSAYQATGVCLSLSPPTSAAKPPLQE
jgi:hypothetical protein